ncbi:MAG: TIGR01212 family radical SAM protein [Bacteroidales bacterium]|nr:TIGR01212 family radical SAM protein [Bacteroidales bacterium]
MYSWGHNRRFNSYTEYIRSIFGGRVQKVVVDAGFTCPNRDGTKGTGGCTYCNNDAFNPSYCNPIEPVHTQIAKGIDFHSVRYRRAKKFLVYFQPYSNTYAPLSRLKVLYEEALAYPDVVGLVLGTRPDCVDEEKLHYLAKISESHFVQVEYGVESCSDKTLQRINRGHDFETSQQVIQRTHELGIHTGAHFIFGLPGENLDEMIAEANIISRMPIDTVKFHQLQVVRGTRMELEYMADPSQFHQFSLEEYIDFIIRFLERLSPDIVVERFAGEVPPQLLHHLSWDLIRYDEVLKRIEKELERRETYQGSRFKTQDSR